MVAARLLGYDLRHDASPALNAMWSLDRREQYLLRPEIALPKSVDRFVWPSAFHRRGQWVPGSLPIVELVDDMGDAGLSAFGYWSEPGTMRTCFETFRDPSFPEPVPLAVTVEPPPASVRNRRAAEELGPYDLLPGGIALPDSGDWRFLGFDVADGGGISALSNCGYTGPERRRLRKEWGRRLTGDGLLAGIEEATLFRDLSDERVAEHAPFFVYGLWRGAGFGD